MLRGELYDPRDPELVAERLVARQRLRAYNDSPPDDPVLRERLLRAVIPRAGTDVWIEPPFHCDYGGNITLGDRFYCNFGCVILDVAPVTFGRNVLLGPAVQVYAATHPHDPALRRASLELGAPVTIGDDVWIGGAAVVCPGVRIGARSVIGAGSVVVHDIPDDVLAVGNPCRVVRRIRDGDRPSAA